MRDQPFGAEELINMFEIAKAEDPHSSAGGGGHRRVGGLHPQGQAIRLSLPVQPVVLFSTDQINVR